MNDDLISRQTAIDMFNRLADDPWNANANTTWSKAYGYAAEMIEELPSAEPRWIPVSERLPEPYSGEYLVTINDGSIYTDVLWFDSPGDGRYESIFYKSDDDGYGVVCTDVTAWMPLPKPWKGGAE